MKIRNLKKGKNWYFRGDERFADYYQVKTLNIKKAIKKN